MSTDLDSIVVITITKSAAAPTQVGFGIPLVMAYHTNYVDKYREYTSVTDMIVDGFSSTDPAVRCVGALLSQNPKPVRVVVGREANTEKQKIVVTPVVATLKNLWDYTVTVNGLDATFTTDATATAAEVTAGLKIAIDALSQNVVVTDNTTDIDIESVAIADQFRLETAERDILVQENTTPDGAPGIVADITAVQLLNDDWYSLHLTNIGALPVKAAAVYIETLVKMMGTSSADDEIYDSGVSDDLASALQTLGYDRTFLVYSPKALTEYPAAGWAGGQLPQDPGSITWMFKSASGVSTTNMTTTELSTLEDKACNVYLNKRGLPMFQYGVVSSGEFIDVTRGIDWTQTRIQERIYASLINAKKIPYTDTGAGVLENDIRGVLQEGVTNDLYRADPAPTVTVPKVADQSVVNRAARYFPGIEFTAQLAGAVHKTGIQGYVSV